MPTEPGNEEARLRVVDEDEEVEKVLRLEEGGVTQREAPKRLAADDAGEVERIEKAPGVEADRRSTEPDFDTLLDAQEVAANPEEDWRAKDHNHPVPYGWFILILLGVGALAATSLWHLTNSDQREAVEEVRQASLERIEQSEVEEAEAERSIAALEATVRGFFEAGSVDEMLPLVRHPERVEPLMHDWYSRHGFTPREVARLLPFHPLEVENQVYWLVSCEMRDEDDNQTLIIEQQDGLGTRVDWETMVCYQPMDWDDYVRDRPEEPLEFRVYIRPDLAELYVYEFADEEKWEVYRLTSRDGDDYLFGYVERGSEAAAEIAALTGSARGRRASPILRLKVPDGSQSPRGVEIQEVVSERWMIIDTEEGADAP